MLTALIAYYKLDEVGGANDAKDSHVSNLDFTQVHSPGSDFGKLNTCRTGDAANDYFFRSDNADFSTGDVDFTIAAWIYLDDIGMNSVIFAKFGTAGEENEYALFYNDNDHIPNHRFSFIVSSDGMDATIVDADTFGAPALKTWYHVVAWHDARNDQIGISVNTIADTKAYALGVHDGTTDTYIGAIDTTYRFNGCLDEMGFWKSAEGLGGALTTEQRQALYNAGVGLAYEDFT